MMEALWQTFLTALISGLAGWLIASIRAMAESQHRKEQENDKQLKALENGVRELLHDRIYQACSFFIARGYCSPEDRNNLEYLFRPYKERGGNGTGESLYHKCMDLPLMKEEKEAK